MNNKNERILFSSNQIKFTGSLISGLVFIVVGIWFVSIKNITGLNINIAGWLFIILGGLCIVVFIMSLLPNRNYLHLNYEGFTVFSTFRKRSYFWSDVELFTIAQIGASQMVVFNFNEQYKKSKRLRRVAKTLSGFEDALPDTYGMSLNEIAGLLNEFRSRYKST